MSLPSKSIVFLMTGTINPNSFNTLILKDPKEREQHYISALNYYLSKTDFPIVFVENSGHDLKRHFEQYIDRIEFLTFTSEPTLPDRGKGFKELEIMDYAFKYSKLITNADSVVKITGRLKVLNITSLTRQFLKRTARYHHMASSNMIKSGKMDSRCFFFTKDFWATLRDQGRLIHLNYPFEMALWDSMRIYNSNGGNYKLCGFPFRIEGISGGFGTPYNSSLTYAFIKHLKNIFLIRFSLFDKEKL